MPEVPERPMPQQTFVERARTWVQWVGTARVVAAAVVVVAVIAGGYWLLRPPATPIESTLPYAQQGAPSSTVPPESTPLGSTTNPPPDELVVHVAGAVVTPGVHRVATGGRVVDAISAAGGLAPGADPDALNLAAPLVDGQRVYVPLEGEVVPVVANVPAPPGDTAPPGPVNLNSATAAELESLPGVGPATAAAIIAHRDEHGPFLSVEGLGDVAGIGPAKLDALRGLVTV